MNELAEIVKRPETYTDATKALAQMNAEQILKEASPELLEAIVKAVAARKLTERLEIDANLAAIDYEKEKKTFLDNAGNTASKHTRRSYANAINKLENFANSKRKKVLELTPAEADDFIYLLKAAGASSASVRLNAAGASSFFTWLERRHGGFIKNPFRGSKARPAAVNKRGLDIPAEKEVGKIIEALPGKLSSAVAVMAGRGLRCGALPSLSIKGCRFTARSKGKDISGEIEAGIVEAIKKAGLELRGPFADLSAEQIQHGVEYRVRKLYKAGIIHAAFSCHDFRHYYAVGEDKKLNDVKRLQVLLGHSGIAISDRYLKSLEKTGF
jgi:site-specific recombinase XerD